MTRSAVVLALLVALLGGCTIPPPEGDAPLRYRDEVFSSLQIDRDLRYGAYPELVLDRYLPVGDTAARRPAVIWVHGGGFKGGSKDNEKIVDLANTFARLGYVSVAIEYRLLAPDDCAQNPMQQACVDAALAAKHDGQAAVRWLRAKAGPLRIDPNRIAIGGLSAGGIVSLAVGTTSEDPGTSGNPGYPSNVRSTVSICAALFEPFDEFRTPGDAPTLFLHGTRDPISPIAWARANVDAFVADNVPALLDEYVGEGHCPRWSVHRQRMINQAKYFLYYLMDLRPGQI